MTFKSGDVVTRKHDPRKRTGIIVNLETRYAFVCWQNTNRVRRILRTSIQLGEAGGKQAAVSGLNWCYLYLVDTKSAVALLRFVDSGTFGWAIVDARQWSKQGKDWIICKPDGVIIAQSANGRKAGGQTKTHKQANGGKPIENT